LNGFHFYNLYLDCPRKWYLKYVNGLQPEEKSPSLIFGSAFHEGKAVYWENGYDGDGFLEVFQRELREHAHEYMDQGVFQKDLQKGLRMIDDWLSTWDDENRERYKPLEVEQEYQIPIGPNGEFIFTIRPDVVLKDLKAGTIIIEDTKTTGWSVELVQKTNELADQLTSYIWGVRKMHPEWNLEHARLDISYARQSKIASHRTIPLYRSKGELAVFEMNLYGIILEVSQKYKSLAKYPWPLLFPRNGNQCWKFNRECEYARICRMNIPIGQVPPGFTLDPWAELDSRMTAVQKGFSMEDFKA